MRRHGAREWAGTRATSDMLRGAVFASIAAGTAGVAVVVASATACVSGRMVACTAGSRVIDITFVAACGGLMVAITAVIASTVPSVTTTVPGVASPGVAFARIIAFTASFGDVTAMATGIAVIRGSVAARVPPWTVGAVCSAADKKAAARLRKGVKHGRAGRHTSRRCNSKPAAAADRVRRRFRP